MSGPGAGAPLNPFPGLRPFREDEQHLFFGRESQVDAMVDRLAATRFLAVVGTSGSGKSSLVNCGLRPALRQGLMARAGSAWRMAQCRPGTDPIGALARALAQDGVLFRDHAEAGLPLAEIVATTLRMSRLGLVDIVEQAALGEGVNLLVVVDQFEELFRYRALTDHGAGGADVAAFVDLLLEVKAHPDGRIHVVLTMRSDFLGDCTRFPGLAEAVNDGQYLVPRMTRDERRAAIAGPAAVGGATISPVLLTRLINDVGDNPDQLSILQHALNRTWARWQDDGDASAPLDLVQYEAIGTMAQALDRHAEQAYALLDSDRARAVCEKLFKALTDQATDPRGIRRPTPLSGLCALADASAAEVTAVIEVFRESSRSFLMPPAGEALTPATVVDISHESLMRVWQRLDAWATAEALSAQTYRRLAETAALHAAGQASLWRDPELAQALAWQQRERPNAAWASRYGGGFEQASAFLRDSEAARDAATDAERQRVEAERLAQERELAQAQALAQAQRQRADEQAAARVRQQRLAWVLVALLVLAVGAAGFGWSQMLDARSSAQRAADSARLADLQRQQAETSRAEADVQRAQAQANAASAAVQRDRALAARAEAEDQRADAIARRLLFASRDAMSADNDRALLLAVEGARVRPLPELRARLRESLAQRGQRLAAMAAPTQGRVTDAAWGATGTRIVSTSFDAGAPRIWDARSARLLATCGGGDPGLTFVAPSPDGRRFVVGGPFAQTSVWTLDGDACVRAPAGAIGANLVGASWRRDGRLLTTSKDGTVSALDLSSGRSVVFSQGEPVNHAVWSPDGGRLLIAGRDKIARIRDLAGDARPIELVGHFGALNAAEWSADGARVVTASDDGTARVWDASGTLRAVLAGHAGSVVAAHFDPTGARVVTAGADGTARVWNAADGAPEAVLAGHQGPLRQAAWSADGQRIVTASTDGTVGVWDPDAQPFVLRTTEGTVRAAYSPDGQRIVAGGGGRRDGVLRVWDAVTGQALWTVVAHPPPPTPVKGLDGGVLGVAWSPDGRHLVSAGRDGTARIWDADNGAPQFVIRTAHPVNVAAWRADGTQLLTATDGPDATAQVWSASGGATTLAPLRLSGAILDAAWSPDGTRVVITRDQPPFATIWHPQDGSKWDLPAYNGLIWSARWSPDGRRVVTAGNDATARVWDAASGRLLKTYGHPQAVHHAAWNPRGTRIATASDDGRVRIFDPDARGEAPLRVLAGHGADVRHVAWSPDGRQVVSASKDLTARVWDAASGSLLATLGGHTAGLRFAAWNETGTRVLTAADDATARVHRLQLPDLIDAACRRSRRELTPAEWSQYVGTGPYRMTCPPPR